MQNIVHLYRYSTDAGDNTNKKAMLYTECKPVLLEYVLQAADIGAAAGQTRDVAGAGIRGLLIFETDAYIKSFGALGLFKAPAANAQDGTASDYKVQNPHAVAADTLQYTLTVNQARNRLYLIDTADNTQFRQSDIIRMEILLTRVK